MDIYVTLFFSIHSDSLSEIFYNLTYKIEYDNIYISCRPVINRNYYRTIKCVIRNVQTTTVLHPVVYLSMQVPLDFNERGDNARIINTR